MPTFIQGAVKKQKVKKSLESFLVTINFDTGWLKLHQCFVAIIFEGGCCLDMHGFDSPLKALAK